MFSRLAEIAEQYLKRGSKVFVEGKLQTRKWQDQEGKDRYTTEVVAKEMTMLDSRSTSQAQENSPKVESEKPKDDFEEDIPF